MRAAFKDLGETLGNAEVPECADASDGVIGGLEEDWLNLKNQDISETCQA